MMANPKMESNSGKVTHLTHSQAAITFLRCYNSVFVNYGKSKFGEEDRVDLFRDSSLLFLNAFFSLGKI